LVCAAVLASWPGYLRAQKQVDIGAAEAPLSDAERVDLDKAAAKHDYAAEKAVIDQAMSEHPNSFELLAMAGRLKNTRKTPRTRWPPQTRSNPSRTRIVRRWRLRYRSATDLRRRALNS
jgi:hypothetical protein